VSPRIAFPAWTRPDTADWPFQGAVLPARPPAGVPLAHPNSPETATFRTTYTIQVLPTMPAASPRETFAAAA